MLTNYQPSFGYILKYSCIKSWNIFKCTQLTAFIFWSYILLQIKLCILKKKKKKEEPGCTLYLNFPTVSNFNLLDLFNVFGQKCFSYQCYDCRFYQGCCSSCTLHGGQIVFESIPYHVYGFSHNTLCYYIKLALHLFHFRQRKSRQWALRHAAVIAAPVTKTIKKKFTIKLKESIYPTSLRITQLFRCHVYDVFFGTVSYKPLPEAELWDKSVVIPTNQETVNRVRQAPP